MALFRVVIADADGDRHTLSVSASDAEAARYTAAFIVQARFGVVASPARSSVKPILTLDEVLTQMVRKLYEGRPGGHPSNWWGHSGSGGNRRVYRCYFDRVIMDTESARYPPTQHAWDAVLAHRARHEDAARRWATRNGILIYKDSLAPTPAGSSVQGLRAEATWWAGD